MTTPKKLTIAVDIDDTVADLMTEWLRRYNRDYGDAMTPNDITQWAISKCVKPECGTAIWKYLEQHDLYTYIKPVVGALDGVNALRAAGHRVVFVTSCGRNASTIARGGDKFEWLKTHGFFANVADPYLDFIICADKTQVTADTIVDDRWDTIKAWSDAGRFAILVNRPHNSMPVPAPATRSFDWQVTVDLVSEYAAGQYPSSVPEAMPVMMLPAVSAERKRMPIATGVLDYFPLAMAALARLSKFGNDKHNPGEPLHWSRSKSGDHADCVVKHLIDRGTIDPDTGELHDVPLAWRAMALLELAEEKRLDKPISRGSIE